MDSEEVTLSMPCDLLAQAEVLATRRGITVSLLLTEALRRLVEADERYDQARRRGLALLEKGFGLGTHGHPPATRDEVHER